MGRETNKNRRQAQAQSAREKAAAARALQQQAERRRRAMVVLSSIVVLAVVAAVIAVVALNHKSSNKGSASDGSVASASVIDAVRTVPAATLKTVAQGDTISAPSTLTGSPLESDGKPELLYIGAEFCPYCAGERWSMAVALSRFGTLDNVKYTTSAADDVDPNTATLDFKDAKYTSKYLTFTPVENQDREHNQLQAVTDDQNKLWGQYSTNGQRGFPFLDFGNKYVVSGPSFDPKVLAGLTQQQIASRLADPSDSVAKSVDGGANLVTAAICGMTDNQPASVCTSDITALSAKFPAFSSSSS